MLTMNPIIVFIMLFVPSLCEDPPEPDFGSPEEFLKEVNEYRAKFAKEHKIPNMYKRLKRNACKDEFWVNGECILPRTTSAPTTRAPEAQTTQKTTPKKPEASDEKKEKGGDAEKEKALEPSVTTRSYSYGPLILVFICLLF
ncbi:hypothetical protein CAEBREN_02809 [Caenorhabditis brenneri]|uniref:Uncharacterized protein n=1 Tax=Caenorhabditis brenneri TaxID=135651 RepID=G0PDP5_CAEBE|nr:hypothetical protein CAEBREN_02809 [Caenorhabditis brenneri]